MKMLKRFIIGFLPWILYSILNGHSQRQLDIAIIAGLAACLILNYKDLYRGFILTWGAAIFFIFMLFAATVMHNQWMITNSSVLSSGVLALITWVSLFIGRPFTLQYAKLTVASEHWHSARFINVNKILTTVWGLLFLFNFAVHISQFYDPFLPHVIYMLLPNASFILGVLFTAWFPKWYHQ